MRGSLFFQTGCLTKMLFSPNMSKIEQKQTGSLANAQTLETYREVWNELAIFTKSMYGIKDLQKLSSQHIESYMLSKASQNITEQRLELISSAIGKLQTALEKFSACYSDELQTYDFSIRQRILDASRDALLVKETSDEPLYARDYDNPIALIHAIEDDKYQLAASIQYESGARLEAVLRIDQETTIKTVKLYDNHLGDIPYQSIDPTYARISQLQSMTRDPYDNAHKGQLLTIEKGGKPGIVSLSSMTYQKLERYLIDHHVFKIDVHGYRRALMNAAKATNQSYNGSHGLRWNFAQKRFLDLQILGKLTYEQALQQVSWEMKHERAEITEHYLRIGKH